MVKNFSVDWLAQSYHDSAAKQDPEPLEITPAPIRPHVPCVVQPRPPTSYDKGYLQLKPKCARTEQNAGAKEKEANLFISLTPRNCSSPISSENSGYSSGYESEAAASECPSVEDGSEGERDIGPQRRIRTKFTPEQIDKLEKIFSKHKYLDAGERVKTALKLNLSETQVRTWFQNRRMKLKREVQEIRAEYLVPALPDMVFPAVPAVQHHCFGGQRPNFPPVPHVMPLLPLHPSSPHQRMMPPTTLHPSSPHQQMMPPTTIHPSSPHQQMMPPTTIHPSSPHQQMMASLPLHQTSPHQQMIPPGSHPVFSAQHYY